MKKHLHDKGKSSNSNAVRAYGPALTHLEQQIKKRRES